jgi:hypothetical protein
MLTLSTRTFRQIGVKESVLFVLHEFQCDLMCERTFHMTLCVYLFPFRDEAEAHSRAGQFCSDRKTRRDYKSGSPQRGSEEPQSALYEGEGEI